MNAPPLETLALNPAHRQQLAEWIWEWTVFRALDDPPPAPAPPLSLCQDSHDKSMVQSGDIRLLHPSIESSAVRYVAVIDKPDDHLWTVVPFGLLSTPATPEEIRTNRQTPALRVLACWNRFTMPVHVLQQCWQVDYLTDHEKAWIHSALPEHRVGPPLRHPFDPRWDYVEMESEFRQRVTMASRTPAFYDLPEAESYLKAAEDEAPYGRKDENKDT